MISLTSLGLARVKFRCSGKLPDVHSLIRSVRQLCEIAIDRQQVGFEMQLEAPRYHVLGDAGRLQQVLWNLFSNAIKFTPPGGSIELRTSVVAGTEFRMCLTDSGRGIDWGSLESIFEPFEQGDLSVPTQFGGLRPWISDCQRHCRRARRSNSRGESRSRHGNHLHSDPAIG